jgi:SNF2 family DNA or RNA helicase
MNKMSRGRGGPSVASLNNVLMQMRKNCNHPDLITGPFDGALDPSLAAVFVSCLWGEVELHHRNRKDAGVGLKGKDQLHQPFFALAPIACLRQRTCCQQPACAPAWHALAA